MAGIASEGDEAVVGSTSEHGVGVGPAEQAPGNTYRKGTRWERFVETTCFVCCGVEAVADGQTLRAIPRTEEGETRGQEAMMTGARPVEEVRRDRRRFRRFGGDGWMY